ncbi:hypothetical protein AGR13a_Cc100031 [Agrobacterium genomosp. 13 str. CFBP 6927]|uniref:Uncharacterized protein n=1 Tax=Agrobacterium genomosp. 13 str. CFBP 6927 TaxID=1183428 RepID=A0ABM9VA45_9HYPH|nr:hypothetical protein AGR13a_Cc100031 [Agrobacterium genomosp. 13 str. CFBP 6927]
MIAVSDCAKLVVFAETAELAVFWLMDMVTPLAARPRASGRGRTEKGRRAAYDTLHHGDTRLTQGGVDPTALTFRSSGHPAGMDISVMAGLLAYGSKPETPSRHHPLWKPWVSGEMACQWHFVSGSPLTVAGAATNEDFSLSCSLFTFRNARKEPSQDCYPMGGVGSQW